MVSFKSLSPKSAGACRAGATDAGLFPTHNERIRSMIRTEADASTLRRMTSGQGRAVIATILQPCPTPPKRKGAE